MNKKKKKYLSFRVYGKNKIKFTNWPSKVNKNKKIFETKY